MSTHSTPLPRGHSTQHVTPASMSAGTNTPSSIVQTPGHKTSPPGLGGSTEKTTPSSGQAEDYEENLQQLAAIKLNDDAFQAELSKTDQWFVNLSETAKTATFYQLLQHIDSPPQLQFIHMLVRDRITIANRPTAIITMPPTPSPIEAEQTKPNNLTFNRRSSQPALHSTQEMWPNQLAATDIPINTAGPPRRKSFDFLGEHESFESTNTPFLYLSDSDSGASIVGQRHVAPGSQRVAPSNWAFSRRVSIISDKAETPKHETKSLENLGSLWPAAPLIQRPHGDKGMLRMPKAVGFTGTNRPSSGPANASMPSFYERRSKSISGQGSFGASGSLNTRRTSLPTSPSRRPESRQGNGLDSIDLSIMADIPRWLRNLRLHKYTSVLENLDWKKLIRMNDVELEAHGVTALGARRKLLKYFDMVLAEAKARNFQM